MTSERTAIAQRKQKEAASLRKAGRLLEAEGALREAIALLEEELKQAEAVFSRESDMVSEIARQLADCYGSLGGVWRRMNRVSEAAMVYARGKALEEEASYRIARTYNQVQWIVTSILGDPTLIQEDRMNQQIAGLADRLHGTADNAWAWADVFLLAALMEDAALMEESFKGLKATGAIPDVYKSGLLVFRDLSKVLQNHVGLGKAIKDYESRLSEFGTA